MVNNEGQIHSLDNLQNHVRYITTQNCIKSRDAGNFLIQKYENNFQGQKSRSNVTTISTLLAGTKTNIPTK